MIYEIDYSTILFLKMYLCNSVFITFFQIFNESLYATLKKTLHDVVCPELAFAFRAMLFDATTPNILGVRHPSRPGE